MTTKTDTQAAFEKWLGARADDPTLPHGLIRDAFLAGVEAGRADHFRDATKMVPSDAEIVALSRQMLATARTDNMIAFARALLSRYSSSQPAARVKRPYAQSATLGEYGIIPECDTSPAASAEPVAQELTRSSMSDPCPHCGAGPYYYCAHPFRAAPVAQEPVGASSPGQSDAAFNRWYESEFKPAMERGPFDKHVARQAWFAAMCDALPATPIAQEPRRIGKIVLDAHQHPRAVLETGYDDQGDQWAEGAPIYAAPVAAQAQPTMPPLTDAMRAVLRNEHDVYGDEDALYAALCDAASLNHFPDATKMVSAESVSGADQAQPVAEVVGRQRLENESGSAVPRIAALDMNLQPGQLLYTCPTAAQAQPVANQSLTTESDREAMADEFEAWWINVGQYLPACRGANYKKTFAYRAYEHAYDVGFRAALAQQPSGQSQRQPDGYAYRYRSTFGDGTVIRFNRGEEVNGSRPIDVVPFWYAPPDCAQDREDAERWRHMRRKLCLTGNGNGTCAMKAINLPVAIPGWPEPGQVAEFCDAAIDAAIADDRAAAKEQT